MSEPTDSSISPLDSANPRALEAYATVEARYREDVRTHLQEVAARDPIFRHLMESTPEEVQKEQQTRATALLEGALRRGEWEPYLADLRMQGAIYAQMGIPTASWYQILSEFRAHLTMKLAREPGITVERVCTALEGMNWVADLGMSQIIEAYLSTKEASIRAEQERQRQIFAGAPDAIITFDQSGAVTGANPEAERTFGWSVADALGRPWHELLFPDDISGAMAEVVNDNSSTGIMCSGLNTQGRRFDQLIFPLELTVVALPRGDHREYCAFIRDLSGQTKAQSDQRLLASIVQASTDAIVSVDRLGTVLSWNPGAENMYGHASEEALGADFWTLVGTGSHRPTWLVEPTDQRREIEMVHRRRDGSRVDVSVALAPLCAADGHTIGTALIARDIGERIQAAKALAEKTQQLERSNRELQDFVYAASHDLRAPLRAVDHLSSFLAEDLEQVATGDSLEHLALLRRRVQHMSKMITDLLEYSRIGHRQQAREHVDCNTLVADILNAIEIPSTFTYVVKTRLPVLHTQRAPLQQVFANVLENALKHHDRQDGRVEVSAQQLSDQLYEFTISDDGPGIVPRHRERAFRMFQTLGGKEKPHSSGIGLAMVKKTIESAGGTVELRESPAGGVEFVFTWPTVPG